MAKTPPENIVSIKKSFQEISESHKEILKLLDIIAEKRRKQKEGVLVLKDKTNHEETQGAVGGVQKVERDTSLTGNKSEVKLDKTGVNGANKFNKDVPKPNEENNKGRTSGGDLDITHNKIKETSVSDAKTENNDGDKAVSTENKQEPDQKYATDDLSDDENLPDDFVVTNEHKEFHSSLRSKIKIALKRDNRFQEAIDEGKFSKKDGANEDTAEEGKDGSEAANGKGAGNDGERDESQEGVDSDTGSNSEASGNDEVDLSRSVVSNADVTNLSDKEITLRLEILDNIPNLEQKEDERDMIKIEKWNEYADEEAKNGQLSKELHLSGGDTVFCLDVSASMKGQPLKSAKAFIKNYIHKLQSTEVTDDVYEHVALVTFGSETRVQQHLTYEYFQILSKLDDVKPKGPSPLFAGLKMCWAALSGAGTLYCIDTFRPKMYLLSDCDVTPSTFCAGPDTCSDVGVKMEQERVFVYCANLCKDFQLSVNVITFTDNPTDLQQAIVKESNGEIIHWKTCLSDPEMSDDDTKQSAADDDDDDDDKLPEDEIVEASSYQNVTLPLPPPPFYDVYTPYNRTLRDRIDNLSDDSSEEGDGASSVQSVTDETESYTQDPNFPQLGARVRHKHDQTIGTVTLHRGGAIKVTWDEARENVGLTESILDSNQIQVVHEPRCLKDELIAVGCRVKRGPNWHYDDQNGSEDSEGNVFEVLPTGIVKVMWDNGYNSSYRYAVDGNFDLEILQPEVPVPVSSIPSSNKNLPSQRQEASQVKEESIKEQEESRKKSEECKGVLSGRWRWKDADGSWKSYPTDLSQTIEANYCDNPNGSLLITHNDKQYKVMLKRMVKVDVNTGEKYPVSRL